MERNLRNAHNMPSPVLLQGLFILGLSKELSKGFVYGDQTCIHDVPKNGFSNSRFCLLFVHASRMALQVLLVQFAAQELGKFLVHSTANKFHFFSCRNPNVRWLNGQLCWLNHMYAHMYCVYIYKHYVYIYILCICIYIYVQQAIRFKRQHTAYIYIHTLILKQAVLCLYIYIYTYDHLR